MNINEGINYILLGANPDQVIEDMMLLDESFKKYIGVGAGIGGVSGSIAGYRRAKKNKTSRLKGALKGAGIGALGGGAIGAGVKNYRNDLASIKRSRAQSAAMDIELEKGWAALEKNSKDQLDWIKGIKKSIEPKKKSRGSGPRWRSSRRSRGKPPFDGPGDLTGRRA